MSVYIINYIVIIHILLLSQLFRFTKSTMWTFHILTIIYFTWFIGLRHEVGTDWNNYLYHFENIEHFDLETLLSWNPGYVLLEYFSKLLGLGIYGVNSLCAIIFMSNFVYFVRTIKINLPFSLLIAYPYLIMVVAMGYTRQAVALGFIFGFIASLYKDRIKLSILFIILALLFHETALITLILYLVKLNSILSTKAFVFFSLILSSIIFTMYSIYYERFNFLITVYLIEKMESSGTTVRILLNLLPGLLFLIFYKRWQKYYSDFMFWLPFIIINIFLGLFAIATGATTIADRLLLYFYPIQISILARIEHLFANIYLRIAYIISVIVLYLAVLIVWLFFSNNRHNWIPYDNILFLI